MVTGRDSSLNGGWTPQGFLYGTWYGAGLCFAVSLFAMTLVSVLDGRLPAGSKWMGWATTVAPIFLLVSFLNELAAVVVSLVRKRWALAWVQLFVCVGLVLSMLYVSALLFASGFTGPDDDTEIGRGPVVGIYCSEPSRGVIDWDCTTNNCSDTFSQAVLEAIASDDLVGAVVTADLSSLGRLAASRRAFLVAYLSRHPGWRLCPEGDGLCATRRWKIDGKWCGRVNGFYSGEGFQMRTRIRLLNHSTAGLSGSDAQSLRSAPIIVGKPTAGRLESNLILEGGSVSVEVFEQDASGRWRMTRAALAFLKNEFERLEEMRSQSDMSQLLPDDAGMKGRERLVLRDRGQGGVYDLMLRVNPGESGTVYLKAFKAGSHTPLSSREIERDTAEHVGWSQDPDEKFLAVSEFTVDEGNWDEFYAARFEAWFRPQSGASERKLLSRVYRIQGWQR